MSLALKAPNTSSLDDSPSEVALSLAESEPLRAGLLRSALPGVAAEIERCELPRAGQLELTGWALSLDQQHPRVTVEIRLDDEKIGVTTANEVRSDLKDRLEALDLGRAGERSALLGPAPTARRWSCVCAIPEELDRAEAILVVRAWSAENSSPSESNPGEIFRGTLSRALAQITVAAAKRYAARVEELESIIEQMKQSFFWRLRGRWFSVKRRLRLTDED